MNELFRLFTLTLVFAVASPSFAQNANEREFTLKVLPLLKDKCWGCHGNDPDDIQGGYQMLSREDLLKGGESEEPSIVPGHADQGTLSEAIAWEGLEMPPKENDRLSEEQVALVRRWIEAGAIWPDEDTQAKIREEAARVRVNEDGMLMTTSGGTSAEWTNRRYQPEELWAFMDLSPIQSILPGDVASEQAIDHFIGSGLEEAGLEPAPEAGPRDLVRRLYFGLLGLPPTPEEADAFVASYQRDAPAAWQALVDRLLNDSRYGEHWGRHWLDVTRYADTGGMSNDYERSNMWRYRDYVIRAFNNDKPYNQFVVEQLAGDELADASFVVRTGADPADVHKAQSEGNYNPDEAEQIIATGFLRLGPWDNAMVEAPEARQLYLDDVVNITGQTFLSQTLRCCKCHDHKFDPIPTRDYYRIYAAFATKHMAERPVPFLPEENQEEFDEGRAVAQRLLDFAVAKKNVLVEKREAAARKWFEEHDLPYKDNNARKNLPDEEKPPRHVGLDHVEQGQLKVREQDEWIWKRRLERYQPMAQSVFNASHSEMPWNGARKLRINRKKAQEAEVKNHILTGGALTALGDRVFPGVLSALSVGVSFDAEDPYLLPPDTDGRRLALARWIANENNALALRSIVNRVWQFHFGVGLAANANNFGAKGAAPSHPRLMDYLAHVLVQDGWSLKSLHRRILLSDAYRRSCVSPDPESLASVDPNNRLLSHFPRRRMTSEQLRDSMLAITGELVSKAGGVPVAPEINMEVALQPRMIQFSLAPAYQPSRTPDQRNRRTVYAYHVRGQADPFHELFNQPNPNESCELRESAAVTPQAFTLLNSDMMTDRSIALAVRLTKESSTASEQIRNAFQLVLGRHPDPVEEGKLLAYLDEMRLYHREVEPPKSEYPTSITRSLVEEFSGKPFEYNEILPVFEDYVPDLKPADVDAETRALADLCLLLFNSNEFLYLP
ncbi:MAG: PSD1 and planctomycete cytochrome C domain-containing protein [Planctomycetota bacterium]